jgi:hypothetical protein
MDHVATSIAPAASNKKLTKPKKLAKDFTPDERQAESVKRSGRREAVRARAAITKLEDERHE